MVLFKDEQELQEEEDELLKKLNMIKEKKNKIHGGNKTKESYTRFIRVDGKCNEEAPVESIITVHRETDGCYSVYVEFLVNEKGDLKFRFINDKGDNMTQDEFMMGPATAY